MTAKWEHFLESRTYIISVCLYTFLIWCLRFIIPESNLLPVVFCALIPLSIVFLLILTFSKKTVFTIPIFLSYLFSIGLASLDLDAFDYAYLGLINVVLILAGFIIHLIKNKIKLRLNALGIGLLLVVLSFFIPFIYQPITVELIFISSISLVFLAVYIFYSNTLKGNNINYLFRSILFIGLALSFQLAAIMIQFIAAQDVGIYDAILLMIKHLNVNAPGWGNINDLTIHLVLFSSAIIYYLYKHPRRLFPWIIMGWYGLVIYLSFSRGSMLTFGLLTLLIVIWIIITKDKAKLKNLGYTAIIALVLLIVNYHLLDEMIAMFTNSLGGGWDNMLTGRVTLWWKHDQSAVALFKQFPIFGYGWNTPSFLLDPSQNRITIYHSTFFHVLATGGIFGILVLGFHWYQIGTVFKNSPARLAKYAILTTYIITQLHGLVDNTQYMLNYTVSTLIIITVLETSSKSILSSQDLLLEKKEIS